MKNVVVNSDVREVFPYIPDQSIHLTFTSPPLLQRSRLLHLYQLSSLLRFSLSIVPRNPSNY
ncbi:hypothetical protein NIES3806_01520 [Microcystis aeruginosa NIES-3806]|uniref:Uncharacterized protein n=4 Tax=Microcystis aeruginosa TaxID=1126 RepID=A0A0F6U396_MICAE|nr:hypothetical protein MYAER_1789 [Microcystis aeruginosa NIES-2549]GCA78285.1 hypothetical protein MiTs_00263 [Microcystis aeruginosa NIES-2521]GCL44472.1 hypothetical protein NIES3787_01480 [Microcystis aeruginosa NIES-3787]GCL52826.1 hypothetical protein NIES3806_01520 [Microcystis aeruginosa NIES-3806]GCL59398.1 hypothetical protein NIES3807_25730 [Microcystis aeruginosa NIES-3807]